MHRGSSGASFVRGCWSLSLAGCSHILRRVAFPENPPVEWFVVDLFENAEQAGVSRAEPGSALQRALERKTFDRNCLRDMAHRFGTKRTWLLIESALARVAS